MYLLREIVQLFTVKLILIQVSCEIFKFQVGEIHYEYDNESSPLGRNVYKGIRKEGNKSEVVAFKESDQFQINEHDTKLYHEKVIYEAIGEHDSIPTFYHYFSRTNRPAVLVIELLGETVEELQLKYKPFSAVTILRIGLHLLDIIEYMHSKGVVHEDLHLGNLAVGAKNDSNIYIFDFDWSNKYSSSDLFMVKGAEKRRRDIEHIEVFLRTLPRNIQEVWNEFYKKSRESGPFDYEEFRKILRTELENHEHELNYDKFDWQHRTPAKQVHQKRLKFM